AAATLSDPPASGADPEALVVTFAAPPQTELADVLELYEGLAESGVHVAGGDTSAAGQVVLSVPAIGPWARGPGRAVSLVGDLLVVSGPLGASGAAFRSKGYARPPIRLEEGKRL